MRSISTITLLSALLLQLLATAARAEDVTAKKMQIKTNHNSGGTETQVQYQIQDPGVLDADDGYTATGGVRLHVFNTGVFDACVQIDSTDCVVKGSNDDILDCKSLDGSGKVKIQPGKVKAKFKGLVGTTTDLSLALGNNQLPFTMVLRLGNATYCSTCGNGGTDSVKKDGSDGKQVMVTQCDVTACPVEIIPCFPPQATPCGLTDYPTCAGICPSGQTCEPVIDANSNTDCRCSSGNCGAPNNPEVGQYNCEFGVCLDNPGYSFCVGCCGGTTFSGSVCGYTLSQSDCSIGIAGTPGTLGSFGSICNASGGVCETPSNQSLTGNCCDQTYPTIPTGCIGGPAASGLCSFVGGVAHVNQACYPDGDCR